MHRQQSQREAAAALRLRHQRPRRGAYWLGCAIVDDADAAIEAAAIEFNADVKKPIAAYNIA